MVDNEQRRKLRTDKVGEDGRTAPRLQRRALVVERNAARRRTARSAGAQHALHRAAVRPEQEMLEDGDVDEGEVGCRSSIFDFRGAAWAFALRLAICDVRQ